MSGSSTTRSAEVTEQLHAIKQRLAEMDNDTKKDAEQQHRTMINAKRRNAIGRGKDNDKSQKEEGEATSTEQSVSMFRVRIADSPPPDWAADEKERKSQRRREIRSNLQQTRQFLRQHPDLNVPTRADKVAKMDTAVQLTTQVLIDRGFSDTTMSGKSQRGHRHKHTSSSQQKQRQHHQQRDTAVSGDDAEEEEDEDVDEANGRSPAARSRRRHHHHLQSRYGDDDEEYNGPLVDEEYWAQLQAEGHLSRTSHHHHQQQQQHNQQRHSPTAAGRNAGAQNGGSEQGNKKNVLTKKTVTTYDDLLREVEEDIQWEATFRGSTSGAAPTTTTTTATTATTTATTATTTAGGGDAGGGSGGGPGGSKGHTIGNAQSKYLRRLLQDELSFLQTKGNESRSGALWFGGSGGDNVDGASKKKPATAHGNLKKASSFSLSIAAAARQRHQPSDITRPTMSDLCRHRQPPSLLLPPLLPSELQQQSSILLLQQQQQQQQQQNLNSTTTIDAANSTRNKSSGITAHQKQQQQQQLNASSYDPDYYETDATGHSSSSPHRVRQIPAVHHSKGYADISAEEKELWRKTLMRESHERARQLRMHKEERELAKRLQAEDNKKNRSKSNSEQFGAQRHSIVSVPPSGKFSPVGSSSGGGKDVGGAQAFNYHGPNHAGATTDIPVPDSKRVQQLLRGVFVKGGDVASFMRASAMEAKNGLMRHDERRSLRARLGGTSTGR